MINKIISNGNNGVSLASIYSAKKNKLMLSGYTDNEKLISLGLIKNNTDFQTDVINISNSDGLLFITSEPRKGHPFYDICFKFNKPYFCINLKEESPFFVFDILDWIKENNIKIININGDVNNDRYFFHYISTNLSNIFNRSKDDV